jgi:tryptophanyl-tRNA synthetase
MMDVSHQIKELQVDARVAYVYESGAMGHGQVSKVFNDNLNDATRKNDFSLLSIGFQPKKDFLPLQAADIRAYELYKQLPKELKLSEIAARYPLKFLADIPHRWGFLDGNELKIHADLLSIRAELEDTGELKKL